MYYIMQNGITLEINGAFDVVKLDWPLKKMAFQEKFYCIINELMSTKSAHTCYVGNIMLCNHVILTKETRALLF